MRKWSIALIVLGTVVGVLAVFAVWAKRQVLETNTWTDTSTELLADDAVNAALSGYLVDQLYANVDVEGELRSALPPQAQALAGPAAGGLRELAVKAASEALQRPRVQDLWKTANEQAHGAFLHLIEGGGPAVSTTGGDVTLNLGTIVEQLAEQTGISLPADLPPDLAELDIIHADQLSAAQDGVNLLRKLAFVLPFLALALYGLAIYLERDDRRRVVRAAGFGFIAIGGVVLVARNAAGNAVVDSLASTDSVKPAVESVWSIGTSLLKEGGAAMVFYGVLIVLGAWLAGPMRVAQSARRTLSPGLRQRSHAYGLLLVVLVLLFLWSPTPGFTRLIPSLVLIALFVAGLEALRGQTLREYPEETWDTVRDDWRNRWHEFRGAQKPAPAAPEASGGQFDELARLGELHRTGVLDAEEFRTQKQRILASL